MKTKAIQLAVAVIAGVGLGVLAANYFARRQSATSPPSSLSPQTPALQAEPARREANSNTPTQPSPSPLAPGPSPLPPTQNPKPTTTVLSSVPVTLSIISFTEEVTLLLQLAKEAKLETVPFRIRNLPLP
jgi:hypothetical protein